jgi:hypothetical protein
VNTRRYPRTLQEAFGPYASGPVHPMREPCRRYRQDWCLYAVAVVALVVIGVTL